MSNDLMESLLERLCSGDASAAEEVFLKYEPTLRIIVRRMLPARLRSKFDSVDVVQSVWGDLLRGFRAAGWRFASADHLKAFLIKATRNRFLARQRKHQPHLDREQSLDDTNSTQLVFTRTPQPVDEAQANELWEHILASCSTQHRAMVELRRQGYSLTEIAQQTGYHPSSVRRIFYELAYQTGQRVHSQDPETTPQ